MRVAALLLSALCGSGAYGCSLNVVYSDVAAPPYIVGDGNLVPAAPGIAVEIVNEAASRIGCRINWQRLPNRRVQQEMERGRADAMLMYSFSPERAAYAAYPMKNGEPDPGYKITTLSYYVYTKADSAVSWNGQVFSNLMGSVGVNSGYSVAHDLRKLGLAVEEARSTEQNLTKLQLGRIAAYVMQDAPADQSLEESNIKGIQKLPQAFSSKDYFLAFSKTDLTATASIRALLWEQIAKTSKERSKALQRKYSAL